MTITITCAACAGDFKIPESLFLSRFAGRETKIKCKKCGGLIVVDGLRTGGARGSVPPPAPGRAGKGTGRASVPARPSAPTLPVGAASRARVSNPPARTSVPPVPRRVSTPPAPGRTSRPPARPSSVAGRRSPLASAQRRRSSRPPAGVLGGPGANERVSVVAGLTAAARDVPPVAKAHPLAVTKREGGARAVASAVAAGSAAPAPIAVEAPAALTAPTAPAAPEIAPAAPEIAPEPSAAPRSEFEVAVAPSRPKASEATSTSSASLRAVELPPVAADSDTNELRAEPAAEPSRQLAVSRESTSAARVPAAQPARGSGRAFWVAGAGALVALVVALNLPGQKPAAQSSAPEGAPRAERGEAVSHEPARAPRTEAAIASGTGSETAPTEVGAAENKPVERALALAPVAPAVDAAAATETVPATSPTSAVAYSVKALEAALHWGFTQAEDCHRGGRPVGTARVTLTFGPNGKVSRLELTGEPIASAPVSKCILSYLRSMMIPAFSGPEFTIEREITLR